jgi:large subunit ribosomal protein L15
MRLDDLFPAPGSNKRRKVVGRGTGSAHGKTSTRGSNGNKARGQVNPNFEGGQTPLHRRLPQQRGFKPVNKVHYAVVNLGALDGFDDGTEVTPQVLAESGLLRDAGEVVKVLADGALTKKLTVRAHKFSANAAAKIQAAGGAAEVL